MHTCPAPGCSAQVPYDQLACPSDWYRIPKPIRAAVWRAWDHGRGANSPQHEAAIAAAIRSLQERGTDV